MERNEDRQVVQERPSSSYHTLPLFHHHSFLRVDNDVSLVFLCTLLACATRQRALVFSLCSQGDRGFLKSCSDVVPLFRAYLPTLIPVEVDERKAKAWFRLLLSGVEFLHRRGVVHNDIKCGPLISGAEFTRF